MICLSLSQLFLFYIEIQDDNINTIMHTVAEGQCFIYKWFSITCFPVLNIVIPVHKKLQALASCLETHPIYIFLA